MNYISEEEAALYDRQIRLWGLEAQNRLKHSRVLLIGMTPLAAEVSKNIVLAGVAKFAVIDDHIVTESDCLENFLINFDAIGRTISAGCLTRLQLLNPMVEIATLPMMPMDKLSLEAMHYDVIIVASSITREDIEWWKIIGAQIRKQQQTDCQNKFLVFISTRSHFGVAFFNLGSHAFVSEEIVARKQNALKRESNITQDVKTNLTKKKIEYKPLEDCLSWNSVFSALPPKAVPKGFFLMRALCECIDVFGEAVTMNSLKSTWSKLSKSIGVDESLLTRDDFESCCGPMVPSVNAILGGVVAQELVRAVTGKGAPDGNWYFLDGIHCSVTVEWLPKHT